VFQVVSGDDVVQFAIVEHGQGIARSLHVRHTDFGCDPKTCSVLETLENWGILRSLGSLGLSPPPISV
jgi:hypothetical protein